MFENVILSATITQQKAIQKLGKDIAYLETDISALENRIRAHADPLSVEFWDNVVFTLETHIRHDCTPDSVKARFIRKLL